MLGPAAGRPTCRTSADRCGPLRYRDATIPVEESISHVCADLRHRRYLQQPHVAVDYMASVTGESLHTDLVNFDILAKKNYERFKARMLGEKNT